MTKRPTNGMAVPLDNIKECGAPLVLAIGMFDGFHTGHAEVLKAAGKAAKELGAKVGVLTFSPHPSKVVDMGRPPVNMIFTPQIRAEMFAAAGAEWVFVKKFDKSFAARTSDSFGKFLKRKFPNLKGIVTGENFLYGKGATGNAQTMLELAERNGWRYTAVKGVYLPNGKRMSSSLMRSALEAGNLKLFKKICGRDYAARGTVCGGKKLGRALGVPTLNLKWNPDCKPPFGAYAVRLKHGRQTYEGVANYGTNPTVGKVSPLLESHLFKNVRFGEGETVEVKFLKFLRPEKKFASLDALKRQIAKDKLLAKRFFAENKKPGGRRAKAHPKLLA